MYADILIKAKWFLKHSIIGTSFHGFYYDKQIQPQKIHWPYILPLYYSKGYVKFLIITTVVLFKTFFQCLSFEHQTCICFCFYSHTSDSPLLRSNQVRHEKGSNFLSPDTVDRHHWTAAVEAEKICGNKNHVPLRDPYSSLDFLFHTDALLLFPLLLLCVSLSRLCHWMYFTLKAQKNALFDYF